MKRLFELAGDARIVLSGDTGQHASVARGDALRILEEHSRFQSLRTPPENFYRLCDSVKFQNGSFHLLRLYIGYR